MVTVFLSYSSKDYFFAELAEIKLAEAGIKLWRDKGQLRPGNDWRNDIDLGISESFAVLVALSPYSVESPYVTYEWSYALGKGKPVIPLKLAECKVHPKLEPIQYLDFSNANALPWDYLLERIREIETDYETDSSENNKDSSELMQNPDDVHIKAILAYLNQRGYQMMSFERIRQRISNDLTDEKLNQIVSDNSSIFRFATLKGSKPGLAKLIS